MSLFTTHHISFLLNQIFTDSLQHLAFLPQNHLTENHTKNMLQKEKKKKERKKRKEKAKAKARCLFSQNYGLKYCFHPG